MAQQHARIGRLQRPGGQVEYDVQGAGPLVVCLPGMGELRSSFRFTVPALVEAGFRVATMDLRGHGGSEATFERYDDVAAGTDAVALVEELGGPAVLVGSSMGAGASVWAAAERPDLVAGLALLGPFVRNPATNPLVAFAFRVAMSGPWAPAVWASYLPNLYPARKPADFAEHRDEIRSSMRRPGYARAFSATTRTSHAPVEARLPEVAAPALVVMGEADPDFRDAPAEADWIVARLGAEKLLVPGAGHYPHVELPELVNPALLDFCGRTVPRA
ncbi:MAG TPA: alpha/beta hydrolase [Nocardioidaceae bacterium]|jgi:pimeloyl-ACP methyl ester carboxylesterase